MTKQRHHFWVCISFFFAFIIQGCGGSSSSDSNTQYSISADTSAVAFSNQVFNESTDTIDVNITFNGNGLLLGFAPDSQAAPWLEYQLLDVSDSTATLRINVVSAELLAPDLYETTVRLTTGDTTTVNFAHHDIDISLFIWQVLFNAVELNYADTYGVATLPTQTVDILADADSWTITSDADWLTTDVTTGTGETTVTVTADPTKVTTAGQYQGNLTLTADGSDDSQVLPIEMALDNAHLYTNAANLAFVSTPNSKSLSQTLQVANNSPADIEWQASSDSTWLTVAANNTTDELVVNVDEDALPSDTLSSAMVTVSATDASANVVESTITVSLTQSTSPIENQSISGRTANVTTLANHPTLPYSYFGEGNTVYQYHQLTGERINSLEVSADNSELGQFIIHPSGEFLLARAQLTITNDDGTTSTTVTRFKVNLVDFTASEITEPTNQFEPLQYLTVQNRHYLISQGFEILDDELTQLAWDQANAFLIQNISVAKDTGAIFAVDANTQEIKRLTASANDFASTPLSFVTTHTYTLESLGDTGTISALVASADETSLFLISPSTQHVSFDGTNFTDNGLVEANEDVTVIGLSSAENSTVFSKFNTEDGFYYDVYTPQAELKNTISIGAAIPLETIVTATNEQLVLNSPDNELIAFIAFERFNVSQNEATLNNVFSNTDSVSETIEITGINSETVITSDLEWLSIVETPSEDGTSRTLVISLNYDNIETWGLYSGQIEVYDAASDSYQFIDISAGIDAVRLASNYQAVSLFKLADSEQTQYEVLIQNNSDQLVQWQASTNADWLNLTEDSVNDLITLEIDPSNTLLDGYHEATINITPLTDGSALANTIHVGFYLSASNISDFSYTDITSRTSDIAIDPLQPKLYFADGQTLYSRHLFDNSETNSLVFDTADYDISQLAVSPNGEYLLASGVETIIEGNGDITTILHTFKVMLADFTVTELTRTDESIAGLPIKIVDIQGQQLLVSNSLEIALPDLTRVYWDTDNFYATTFVEQIRDNNTILPLRSSDLRVEGLRLAYNQYAASPVTAEQTFTYTVPNDTRSLSTNNSGSVLYTGSNTNEYSLFDGENYVEQGLLFDPSTLSAISLNSETDYTNKTHFYRQVDGTDFVLYEYDASQSLLSTFTISDGLPISILQPDRKRIITYSNTGDLTLNVSAIP